MVPNATAANFRSGLVMPREADVSRTIKTATKPAMSAERWCTRSSADIERIERRRLRVGLGLVRVRWKRMMNVQEIGMERTVGNLSKKR